MTARRHRYAIAMLLLAPFAGRGAEVTYKIDPAHTYPSFEADHMGISVWRGKMDRTSGTIVYDKAAGAGTIDVDVDLASISFGMPKLDEWARGTDFFNVAKYPTAHYHGRFSGAKQGQPATAEGTMTLHGVSQPMALQIHRIKCIPHPLYKRELCGADALAHFQRDAFGLDAGKSYGFDMTVTLRIQVEALAAP